MHIQFLILRCLYIIKCQLQDIYTRETQRRHQSMLGKWIYMSQILIKIHRGSYTRQLMHATLDRLNYLPKTILITVKSIKRIHKTFQLILRRILKTALEESFYVQVFMISRKRMVQKKKGKILVLRTVWIIEALVWYWYWLGWRKFQYNITPVSQEAVSKQYSKSIWIKISYI